MLQRAVGKPLAFLALSFAAGGAGAAETLRYVVTVDGGKQAGEQVVEHRDDGSTHVRYIFKDNGRGPELEETYRLRPDGTYADYHVTGTQTFGARVDERFRRDGDKALWKSDSEDAGKQVQGAALYVPLSGTPQAASVAIAAIARNGGGALPLLPAGELRQRVIGEAQVESDGQVRTVQLLAQTGVGLTPTLLWATKPERAGEAPRLFSFIVPGWLAAIEEGWEGNVEALTGQQKAAAEAMVREIAGKYLQRFDGLAVLRNVRVFDSVSGVLKAPADVYILRDRITAMLPAGSPSAGVAHEIDGGGRVLVPGLFDMHAHTSQDEGPLHIAAGVTTIRDMGNDNATLQELIDAQRDGQVLAPHIVPAGFLEGESPHSARNGFVVKTLDEAKHAIDWYSQHGYPQLKIYNSFPKEILKDTVSYAHQRGLRVSGHVPVWMRAQDVIDAGFDEIQHINQLMLNFMVTPDTDTRTLERFRLPAEQTAGLDLDGAEVREFIAALKANDVAIDPTLTTFDFIRQRAGETNRAFAAVIEHVPLSLQRRWRTAEMEIPDEATWQRYNSSYEKMVEFVGRAHKAGVTVLPGTDEIAGFTLHRELELYVEAGMTPAEALMSATSVAAMVAGVAHDRGRIAPGQRADLVLLDGNPLEDIANVRQVALVLTQGGWVVPGELYQEFGIKPFVANAPTVRDVAAVSPVR